jgi:mRNA-degrading endonuclease RelE of RelBE toxin-antitoxin system
MLFAGSMRCASSVAADEEPYELVVAGPAARAIAHELSEPVATAVIDLITGALLENPHRVGKPLRNEMAGIWSARRGTFRILFRIDDTDHEVVVLRIEHRRDVYRRR